MNEIRYGIFYKTKSEDINFYRDGRIFKTKKWASTLLYRIKRRPSQEKSDLFLKEVPAPINDTDRLEWMISRSNLAVWSNNRLTTLNHVRHPREAIDQAMRSGK